MDTRFPLRGTQAGPPLATNSGAGQVLDPLWRGLVGYRIIALGYAGALVAVNYPHYRSQVLGLVAVGLMVVWTAVTSFGYLWPWAGTGRCQLAAADLAVTTAGVLSTLAVESADQIRAGAPIVTSVWSAGPALALALERGPLLGLLGALVVQGAVFGVRHRIGSAELTDLLLSVAATLAVGYAATVLRESVRRLRQAVALSAALAERERLARTIHDGVLQVLARIRCRAGELGGATVELGELAHEQEVALRGLMTTHPPAPDYSRNTVDVAAALSRLTTVRTTVAVPAHPVTLPSDQATELVAAVRAALSNVEVHVGPEAPAWVLIEDRADRIVVSVRDDGPGIATGRLDAARAEGRLGVAQSIVGRIEALGGTARCDSEPGFGCEWTFELRRGDG
jgi:signal transduction histidine kinase